MDQTGFSDESSSNSAPSDRKERTHQEYTTLSPYIQKKRFFDEEIPFGLHSFSKIPSTFGPDQRLRREPSAHICNNVFDRERSKTEQQEIANEILKHRSKLGTAQTQQNNAETLLQTYVELLEERELE